MVINRRAAVLALLAMPLGWYRVLSARGGWLAINLDEWTGIKVSYRGQTTTVTAAEIVRALVTQKEQA